MIICFHEINNFAVFESNLKYLKNRYQLLPLEMISLAQKENAFITFDDNYKSWVHAVDILDYYDIPAHFFLNTVVYDSKLSSKEYSQKLERTHVHEFMSYADLETIDKSKIARFSSHTHTHLRLSNNSVEDCVEDIQNSQRFLQEFKSFNSEMLSYPFGRLRDYYNSNLPVILKQCNITKAYTAIRICHPINRISMKCFDKSLFAPRFIWEADKPPEYNLWKSSLPFKIKDFILPW